MTENVVVVPVTALCETGWAVMTSVATPVAVKLCRSMLNSTEGETRPACVAWRVMTPGAVGVTVNTPATGPLIEAAPAEPVTTVRAIGRPELADGATVNEPALMARSAMAAKLTDCQFVLMAPVV